MLAKLTNFFTPPMFERDDEELLEVQLLDRVLNALLTANLILLVLLGIVAIVATLPLRRFTVSILLALLLLIIRLLMRQGQIRLASWLFLNGVWLALTSSALINGGILTPAIFGYVLVIIEAGLLLGPRHALGYMVASMLVSTALAYQAYTSQIPLLGSAELSGELIATFWAAHITLFLLVTILIGIATHLFRSALNRARQELAERRQVEEQLRYSEERFSKAFHSSPTALIFTRNSDSKLEEVNESYLHLFGYPREEVIGKSPAELNIFTDLDEIAKLRQTMRETGKVKNMEMTARAKNGGLKSVLLSVDWIQLGQESYSLTTVMDITSRRAAESALLEERALLVRRVAEQTADLTMANKELAQAARAKDEFLASMSHELRTPLNAILNLTESMGEGVYGEMSRPQQEGLRIIGESGQHLLSLINDILDLSKIEAGQFQLNLDVANVGDICETSLRLMRGQAAQKHLSLQFVTDPRITLLLADTRRLKQILVNLLSNAIKFTSEGGKVGLEVEGDPENQTIRFTVWDSGIGIAEEALPRLFQAFVQLDSRLSREYAGTGLGLALVRRLVELHGGSVSVESVPERGSRFTVALPWLLPPDLPLPDEGLAGSVLRWEPKQALVIDDSISTGEQMMRYMQEWGARTVVYSQGEGSVRQARMLHPDVILLDLLLPDQSGWDVLTRLKADPSTRTIPVIIISVMDEPAEWVSRGAAAYLVKPITRSVLQHALQKALPEKSRSPNILAVLPPPGREEMPLVLLVDDSLVTRQVVGDYLATHGYRVETAESGLAALQQATQHPPDIILLDIQMPGLDGLETTRQLRLHAELATTPIIALTALAMTGDRERCLAAGATSYLAKPVGLKVLRQTLEAHLRQEQGEVR